MTEMQKGSLALIMACIIWGLAPIFYKALAHVAPSEVLVHRTIWSFVTFGVVLALQGRLREIARATRHRGQLGIACFSSLTISLNWFIFIFAIGAGRALEASIGYYIYPLVAVVIGLVVLRESLGRAQWAAVGLAALAVLVLTVGLGVAPWISLVLAVSFATYGLLKRWIDAGPVVSVTVETLLLTPFALIFLVIWGQGAFFWGWWEALLLVLSGPVTAVPLILFSYAAKRVPMSTMGLIQYLNPTLQFLVAWLVFVEPVSRWHAIALPMIWLALALYSWTVLSSSARGKART
ncbi:EamA family transporter RarD [Nioella aestuarii]|uniref:EamA family transporter RarD n=1 Tax=Nioella aestuarii TaxID=1662864 RepID=UPI003D7F4713